MQGDNSAWIKLIILAVIAFVIWWLLHLLFGRKASGKHAAQGIRAAGDSAAAGVAGAGAAAAAGLDRAGDAVRRGADDLAGGVRSGAGAAASGVESAAAAAGGLAGEADAALGRAKDRAEDAIDRARHHAGAAADGAAGAVAGLDMPNVDLADAIGAVPGAVRGMDVPGGLDASGLGADAAAALGGVGEALRGAGASAEEIVGGREYAVGGDGSRSEVPYPAGGREGIPHPHADLESGGAAFVHDGGALGGEVDAAALAAAAGIAAEEIVGGREYEVSSGGAAELKSSYQQSMPAPPRLAGTFFKTPEASIGGAADDTVTNLGKRGGKRAKLAGSDNLREVIEKANPPREAGDDAPRPEDARMYLASSYAGSFEKGGGITAWTWDEGAVDDTAGVANPRGGTCPRDYPVKGNRNSMIYHETWMGTWLPTVPEVCFRTADAAEAAGFRRPKNAQNAGQDQAPLIAQALETAWHSTDPMPIGTIEDEADAEVVLVLPYGAVWAENGECPGDFPLKGNLDSNLYHAPGWPSFEATIAEVCFPDIITAEDAGYDWPKNAEGYPGAGTYKSKGRAAGEPKAGTGGKGGAAGSGGSGAAGGKGGAARGKTKGFAGGAASATAAKDSRGRDLPKGAHWASDGDCPSSRPIKGNLSSMLYHRPGTAFYANTNPEVCFASEADAEAAGYKLPPSQRGEGGEGGEGGARARGGSGSGSGGRGSSGGSGEGRQGVKASGGGSGAGAQDDEGKTTRSGRKAPKGSRLPADDSCPASHPVKGNMDSMLYHAPGWPSYDVTVPEVCFATNQGAAAAGFSRPKNAPDS